MLVVVLKNILFFCATAVPRSDTAAGRILYISTWNRRFFSLSMKEKVDRVFSFGFEKKTKSLLILILIVVVHVVVFIWQSRAAPRRPCLPACAITPPWPSSTLHPTIEVTNVAAGQGIN